MLFLEEWIVIGLVWLTCFISLWLIPKAKRREASVIFLTAQLFGWILGLIVVEQGMIEYPVREFEKANATSFSFEYFILPLICILFNIYYPEDKSNSKKLLYYIYTLAPFTAIEFIVERYTRILNYISWEWYHTLWSMGLVIYMVRAVYKWFYKLKRPLSL